MLWGDQPANDSEIKFEVWLPSANWNGKFHGIGNGGFAGSISYAGLAGAIARGYATASTDTGHNGGDASWALGHPEKIVDYGHRAIHEMTEKAKLIVKALWRWPETLILRQLLEWRSAGVDGSSALSK
ncbi:MAG: tannase/feruloyl esterase family alpha/beta hydrolase [Acidobacteria bacterium]|nr:tannase/feruloyl esterase family alpha/beta hydrolase [Acidobacteriota bacterium]